ncbi:MAG: DNA-processing protein DprA [Solirubrobacteraceae bacterium]
MTSERERAALVALLRVGRRPWSECARQTEASGSALTLLERALGGEAQTTLLSEDSEPLLEQAAADIARWAADGARLVTVLDDAYPPNLREVHDRPPLIFVAGALEPGDDRAIAIIGARRASSEGLRLASNASAEFTRAGYVVVSGLAAGIDTAAHRAALSEPEGRTVAVIGTGLQHSYPPQNAALQTEITERGAVISQFWPDSPPSRDSFPLRNAVMSGLSRGSVVIEASERSGARTQARLALGHARPVFLLSRVLSQPWAREFSTREDVHVVESATEVVAVLERASGRSSCQP